MLLKISTFASTFLLCCLMVTPSEAQLINQLGRIPIIGKVKQATFLGGGCDSCPAEPSCGVAGCADPSCGCEAPSCGLAGSILGSCFGGPGGCGAVIEPACGSAGLGYGGGFGLCGGSCDSCGTGGYLGRNLQRVNPCACGGSLIGDMARGLVHLVDRAVGATVATFFGGLQKVTCHASGTLAALQCAAASACDACGTVGCDGYGCSAGPACGLAAPGCGCEISASCGAPSCGAPTQLAEPMSYPTNSYQSAPTYGTPTYASEPIQSQPYVPTPTPAMDAVPLPQSQPTPAAGGDPFMDDFVPTPQARRATPRANGFRVFEAGPPAPPQIARTANPGQQRTVQKVTHMAPRQQRYLQAQGRPATLRR